MPGEGISCSPGLGAKADFAPRRAFGEMLATVRYGGKQAFRGVSPLSESGVRFSWRKGTRGITLGWNIGIGRLDGRKRPFKAPISFAVHASAMF